jgi:hypothetical protein
MSRLYDRGTRRAKRGLDTGRASATLWLSGILFVASERARSIASRPWTSRWVRFFPVGKALFDDPFRSFVLGLSNLTREVPVPVRAHPFPT